MRAARRDRHGAAHHVVAADGDERVDLELRERRERVVEALRIARDVEPRRAEQHAAVEMDARHLVDRQLALLVGVALREPLESVLEADWRAASLDRFERRRRNHAVGAGRRAAADDDADSFDAMTWDYSWRAFTPREVFELQAERARREARGVGELVDPGGVLEVFGFEADHVGARDPIPLARDVDAARAGLARDRIAQIVERDRHEPAALDADHRAVAAAAQEADRAVAEVAAVFGVERDRIGAAQLVADVLVGDRHLDAAAAQPALHFRFHLAREVDLREADVAVLVALDVLQLRQLRRIELLDQPFGQHRDAERAARRAALDDRAFDDVADVGEGDVLVRELLGDDGQRRAGGLADAEREVTGLAAHRDDDVPAPRRPRILHQVAHELDADVTRGLEAEGGDVRRQRQVVVDRLRHVRGADAALRPLAHVA